MRRKVLAWAIVAVVVALAILIPKTINHGKNRVEDVPRFVCSAEIANAAQTMEQEPEPMTIHSAAEAKVRSIRYCMYICGNRYNGPQNDLARTIRERSISVAYDAQYDVWRVTDHIKESRLLYNMKFTVYLRGSDGAVLMFNAE